MSEAEDIKKKFLTQAKTFRALAKMLSKDPRKKAKVKFCEGMADVCEGLADIVNQEMKKHD